MRLIGVVLIGMLLALGTGCSDKDKTPSGIIPRDQMEKVLWDMIEADQYATTYIVKDSAHSDVKLETMKLYQQVFQLHKISREDFSKSYQYYQSHPEVTRDMFDSLLARGNRLRSEYYTRPQSVAPNPSVPVTMPNAPPPGHQGPSPIQAQPPNAGPGFHPGQQPKGGAAAGQPGHGRPPANAHPTPGFPPPGKEGSKPPFQQKPADTRQP